MGYRTISTGVRPTSPMDGGVWPSPPGQSGMVQLYVEVKDIDATIKKAKKLGARTILPKSELPDGDAMVVMCDPQGLTFGLCKLKAGG